MLNHNAENDGKNLLIKKNEKKMKKKQKKTNQKSMNENVYKCVQITNEQTISSSIECRRRRRRRNVRADQIR